MVLSGRTTVLEGDIILILVITNQDNRCVAYLVGLLTSKTTLKPFSDDAPQNTHFAIGSRMSVAVELRHAIVKARRNKTPHTINQRAPGEHW